MSTTLFRSAEAETGERGRELGRAFGELIRATWETYEGIFAAYELSIDVVREVAEGTYAEVVLWAPHLADEIAGIADGAGLATWQVAALNARSEVLARYRAPIPGECSTAVFVPAGESPRTLQTWDWHEGLQGLTLLWQFDPRPGHTVKTFTEYGVLGKIGVNSAGLGLHFNLLKHDADGEELGVPVHVIARRVLEEASNLAEAEHLIRSARVSASVALTVVSRDAAATFEVSPGGVRRLEPDAEGLLLHTNHFLHPDLARHERHSADDPDTYHRLQRLQERSALLADPDLAKRANAMVSHQEDGAALCCHPGAPGDITERWQTLITIGLDVDAGRLTFRDGNPCETVEPWVEV
jgi:isopenicillin-N N-acyltransferase like protein